MIPSIGDRNLRLTRIWGRPQAREELHRIISNREMANAIILIFANKQDLKGLVPRARAL